MVKANDVAAYLLSKAGGPIEHLKMQKLLYYCQVWFAADNDEELFPERIEAWVSGPVIPDFWREHRSEFIIRRVDSSRRLDAREQQSVDRVFRTYDKYDGVQLSAMTHLEDPWKRAREGYEPDERSNARIDPLRAGAYYRRRRQAMAANAAAGA